MAFHPYPQVIRAVFNPHRFGPPLRVTAASPCSWVDRPGFGSYTQQLRALVTGLAFAVAPLDTSLASLLSSNSPDHNAKGTQSVVTQPKPCPTSYRLYASGFRISFTPRTGVLFTCPSRYSFTIGHRLVFSLGRWSSQIPTGFHVSRGTQELPRVYQNFGYRTITVYGRPFHTILLSRYNPTSGSYNPGQ